jgi:glycosyltransferase involved in cell wall biosynthesis
VFFMVEPQVNPAETVQKPAKPLVTVIIPVFNDAERLKLCLAALAAQTYPKALTEVIVVDNGSEDGDQVKHLVEQFAKPEGFGNGLRAIAVKEPTPGSYAARNRGIALARGEVLAFTDADCIPTTDWIEQGVSYLLANPGCGLVAGEITLFFRNPQRPTPVELFEKITTFDQKKFVENRRFGATANLFTTRKVIDRIGLFNTNLKSGGDVEWGQRVAALGYPQIYAEHAQVSHPARYSFRQLYQRTLRLVGGSHDLFRQEPWFFRRNRLLLQGLLADLLPPLEFAYNAFRDPRLKGTAEKLTVSLVMFVVRYVSAWERVRLMLGGASVRE